MRRVLAIFAASRADTAEATEFLRVLVALRACDVPVELVEAGRGVGVLSREPTPTVDGERYLAALAGDGVDPAPAADLAACIEAASDVLRLVEPEMSANADRVARWCDLHGAPDAAVRALSAGIFLRR